MTPTSSDPMNMKDINNFELLSQVGKGIYGVVYRAIHKAS